MEWLLLVVCVLLVAGNAVFVAAEFSLVTVDRATVQEAAEAGDRRARGVRAALRTLSTQLSGAQLGITITSLVVGFLAEPSLAALLEAPLTSRGIPPAAVTGVAVTVALLIASVFQMVLGELVPKNWAIARPLPVAKAVAPAQRAFTAATGPVIRVLNGNANLVVRRLGIQPQEELASARSAQELMSLVRRSAEVGTLPQPTAALLDRSLHFGGRTAADVLTPRRRVRFVNADTPVADVIELARTSGHSRFPVLWAGDADNVAAVVDLLATLRIPPRERAGTTVIQVADPPLLIPETLELDALLPQLRSSQLGVVIDEYGGTAGIVTLEDVVEELVGEVSDEHDRAVPRIHAAPPGGYDVSALLRPDEVHHLGVVVPDSDQYETLGGFIADELGRIPAVGDRVDIPGWRLTVTSMDGLRVDWLHAAPTTAGEQGGGDE